MSELLLERPPEAMIMPDTVEVPAGYGATEKHVADVAIDGSGLVEVPTVFTNLNQRDEQLSLEHEPGTSWPVTNTEKGIVPTVVPESDYVHPPDMSSIEEARYTARYIEHTKANDEWTSGQIDWNEFETRTADKTPRTYQQPLLRQDGQLFEQAGPIIDDDPNKGVAATDGTFWHGTNQIMEAGDRVLPSGEVSDEVHQANKTERSFGSSSSPLRGTSYEDEQDFAFGYLREKGVLPTPYGKHIYKVSSPNSKIVHTINGPEVWAEGGATVEKRMHPDFAFNYVQANARANTDPFQPGLPGMENGLQFVPEADLDVSAQEFYDKHVKDTERPVYNAAPGASASPEDVALPGLEDYGKRRDVPNITASGMKIPRI